MPYAKGGAPFAGGLAFILPFGTIYSANITADKETGIGNWSDAELPAGDPQRHRDDQGAPLYPGYAVSRPTPHMTDADALAIKAYLFSLAPVHNASTAEQAPLSLQPALADGRVVVLCSIRTSASSRTRTAAPEWNRGAYLAESLGALRRMPHAAQPSLCAGQPAKVRRRNPGRLARLQHHGRQGLRGRRAGHCAI